MQAIVYVYKRPELTQKILIRISEINSEYKRKYNQSAISQIILVHDGLRKEEESNSQRFHQEARELCLYLERTYPQVSTLLFDDNVGLTNHMFRVVEILGEDISDYIFFEEDKAPTIEGVEFLIQNSKTQNDFSVLDTLPLNKHVSQGKKSISTLFTDNGNIMISENFFNSAKKLWTLKDKYQSDFNNNLFLFLSSFLSGYALNRAFGYYSRYISWGLTNADRPDSLLTYALILDKNLRFCPVIPLSENWSDRDTRGKNVNSVPINRGLTCECVMIKTWERDICPKCERQGIAERVALNRTDSIRYMLEFRTRKLLF